MQQHIIMKKEPENLQHHPTSSDKNTSPRKNDSEEERKLKKDKRKRKPELDDKPRKRVTKACLPCQKSHIQCDEVRPCRKCVERGIEAKCCDGDSKKRGRKKIFKPNTPNQSAPSDDQDSDGELPIAEIVTSLSSPPKLSKQIPSRSTIPSILNHPTSPASSPNNHYSNTPSPSIPSSVPSPSLYPISSILQDPNMRPHYANPSFPNAGSPSYMYNQVSLPNGMGMNLRPLQIPSFTEDGQQNKFANPAFVNRSPVPTPPSPNIVTFANPQPPQPIAKTPPPSSPVPPKPEPEQIAQPPPPPTKPVTKSKAEEQYPLMHQLEPLSPASATVAFPSSIFGVMMLSEPNLDQLQKLAANPVPTPPPPPPKDSDFLDFESIVDLPPSAFSELLFGTAPLDFPDFGMQLLDLPVDITLESASELAAPSSSTHLVNNSNSETPVVEEGSSATETLGVIPTQGAKIAKKSPSALQFMLKLIEKLRAKAISDPEAEEFRTVCNQNRAKLKNLQDNLTKEALDSIKRDFYLYLNMFRNTFDQLSIPTFIWERCGIIHFVNKAFVDLTGFSEKTPTDLYSFAVVHLLSPNGLKHFCVGMRYNFLNPNFNSLMFPCGVLRQPEDTYIEGTLCVTIKRDLIGFPLIFIANFLPTKTSFL